MENNTLKNILILIVVGVIVGLIVNAIQRPVDEQPKLKYQKVVTGQGFVDILSQSDSKKTFPIYWVLYRFRAPIQEVPHPPDQPESRFRPHLPPARPLRRGEAGTPIKPDDVAVTLPAVQYDTWLNSGLDPVEVAPGEMEKIHLQIKNNDHAGDRYWVDAYIGYGDPNNPIWEYVPPFQIDVVRE